ncbi:MAG: hypothetical protein R2783_08915 [Gelidibacter sp.]
MDIQRKKVFSGISQVQAMGYKNALSESEITFFEHVIKDSAYVGLFEDISIYVNAEDEDEALEILKALKY